ncbi:ATP-binding cassette domain-containing protein [Symbioplanes lichenis]|uniref:ATP-binding cassette domain-containing protein n=1 Tax=Symbioplanes lichenis TaxID=1629072 RepID=UPI002739D69A|nr:ATP-binding cassette domain-containing protein [Actinoplanes lichenis]
MTGHPAVRTEGLHKRYGARTAVAGLDLTVPAGALFGFLGPNGAGKTTTVGLLSTLLKPTSGYAEVAGCDVRRRPAEVRQRIGLVFQEATLDMDLTAAQNLQLYGDLFGLPRAETRRRAGDLLELMGLSERTGEPVAGFSAGMRRRLEIARGLLHTPSVLFLDEPTAGLDPQTRAAVWQRLAELRAERDITVFLTTHYLEEAENCDQVVIMNDGTLVAEGTPARLKAVVGDDLVRLRTGDDAAAARTIQQVFGHRTQPERDGLRLRVRHGAAFTPRLCAALTVPVHSITVTPPTLDDVFLHYTGHTIRTEGAS